MVVVVLFATVALDGPTLPFTSAPTVKANLMCVAFGAPSAVPAEGELSRACTVTCSPPSNRVVGVKAVPRCRGSTDNRPGCAPLIDPVTDTERICRGRTEEKMIWVCGAAARVPGNGITCKPRAGRIVGRV